MVGFEGELGFDEGELGDEHAAVTVEVECFVFVEVMVLVLVVVTGALV